MSSRPGVQFAFPPLTSAAKWLIAVNAGFFLANMVLAGELIPWFGLSLGGLVEGYGLGVVRIVTYQFVHSYVDPWHLIFNMVFGLYMFGTMAESEVGKRGLVKLYLMSGFVGGAIQLLVGLAQPGDPQIVGASGACYGIMVYAACMAPRARTAIFGIELRWLVGIFVAVGVYMMVLGFRHSGGDVAHGAHVGGALWGWVAFRRFRTSYMTADHRPWLGNGLGRLMQRWKHARAARQHRDRAERTADVDAVLDKVKQSGVNSLTQAERKILERASKDLRGR